MFSALRSKLFDVSESVAVDLVKHKQALITVRTKRGWLEIRLTRDEREYIYITEDHEFSPYPKE